MRITDVRVRSFRFPPVKFKLKEQYNSIIRSSPWSPREKGSLREKRAPGEGFEPPQARGPLALEASAIPLCHPGSERL